MKVDDKTVCKNVAIEAQKQKECHSMNLSV